MISVVKKKVRIRAKYFPYRLVNINVMPTTRETLAEFVTRVMKEKGMSIRKVATATNGRISHSTVADIASGQRLNPSKDTLTELARGIGVSPEQIFRVSRGLSPDPNPADRFEIYAERFDAHDLSESEWQYLELFFKDQIERFKREKIQFRDHVMKAETGEYNLEGQPVRMTKTPAPVVARIEPGRRDDAMTREQIKRSLEVVPIEKPKKRKAG